MTITPDDIVSFWFDEAGPKAWFAVSAVFDQKVKSRFGHLLEDWQIGTSLDNHPWLQEPESALALVITLDQFPRNIYRDQPKAFAFDEDALSAAKLAIYAGFDLEIEEKRRSFFYMPFMHSEDLGAQNTCVILCKDRLPESDSTLKHAKAHRDLIKRFGRFPHRNKILNRPSRPDEIKFLEEGGYAPGAKRPAK